MPETPSYENLLSAAYIMAGEKSQDPRTQNGAVLFHPEGPRKNFFVSASDASGGFHLLRGANRFPYGVEPRLKSPEKYAYIEHAERDVIYRAAKFGAPTQGLGMACPWACCSDCARAVVLAGIRILVRHAPRIALTHDRWVEEVARGDSILKEGGVRVLDIAGKLEDVSPILVDGKEWKP